MATTKFKPLGEALDKLTKTLADKKKKAPAKPKAAKPEPSKQMALDMWPDRVRGVPNAVLRGALFPVSQRRATAKKRELIASVDGIEIRYKGERFNQTDLDVFEMLLHLARLQPIGDRVEFSAQAFLKELGRGTSGKHHEELKEEFARLLGGVVEITWTKEAKTFIGHLVEKIYRDETTQRYVVVFDQKMLSLYAGGYTHIDWEQRKALGNNALAKWLHGFYSTHATAYPMKVETLMSLCGSTAARLGDFRKDLRKALEKIKEFGCITSWEIDKKDHVIIVRVPSLSQQKHLHSK
jgi:hypothetical protein